ncbi:MAG: hypothetical protein KKB50_19090 [Planctomycetes bacterium]|nr:hypothetical protein [Planctomycetota bacterium]
MADKRSLADDRSVPVSPIGPACRVRPAEHSLKANTAYAVIGSGLFNACRFGVIVLLAKLATVEVLGQYTFAMAVAMPVVVFLTFQLRGAFVADAAGEFTFGCYRALQILGLVTAGVVLAAVVAWRGLWAEPSNAFLAILAGVCLGRLVLALPELCWGVFQKRERLDQVAWSNVLRGIVVIVPFAVVLPVCHITHTSSENLAWSVAAAIGLYTGGWWLVFWLFDRPRVTRRDDHDASWSWAELRRLAAQTFPLGLVTLGVTLSESVPRWVIEARADGTEALGYFGALAYVTMVGGLLIIQAGTAASNRLAQRYQSDVGAFARLVAKLTGLAVALGVGVLATAWLCGEWLLRIVFLPEYADHYPEFLLIIAAQCLTLLAIVFGIAVTQMRLFWIQVPVQAAVLLATSLSAYFFIHRQGNDVHSLVEGGAWTLAVRSIVQTVLYAACLLIGLARAWRLQRTG